MILSDYDILRHIESGRIEITPYDRANLGTNSYDVHLSPHLMEYKSAVLDCKRDNPTMSYDIERTTLYPGELYLGATMEWTNTIGLVPFLEGKSSLARLGLCIHITAGFGDAGFNGHWTLEMTVIKPLIVYAGMPIGQIYWCPLTTTPDVPYNKKGNAKYSGQPGHPVPSKMWMNFIQNEL